MCSNKTLFISSMACGLCFAGPGYSRVVPSIFFTRILSSLDPGFVQ